MIVREMKFGEESMLWNLHRETIRQVNTQDYSQAQVVAWASDEIDSATWAAKMQSISPFVVENAGEIVGYSDLQSSGLIDHFFVHHLWQRKGVGKLLMQEIQRRSFKHKISRLESHVSITARPFFESFGFIVVREQELLLRGEVLKNYVMQRGMPCT